MQQYECCLFKIYIKGKVLFSHRNNNNIDYLKLKNCYYIKKKLF